MKSLTAKSIVLGFFLICVSGCESQAGLWMQYYFTPEGWQAQGAVHAFEKAAGYDSDKKEHSADKPAPSAPADSPAPGKPPVQEVGYLDDAALKQSLGTATSDLSAGDASALNSRLIEVLLKSALAAADSDAKTWNTAKLQKIFGKIVGINGVWAQKPTLTVQKNGTHSLLTLKKSDKANSVLAMRYSRQAEDVCRTADAVLKTSDKVGMEMLTKYGEKRTVPHPFGGKPCAKAEVEKNFKAFAVSLDTDGAATVPEFAVLWKNDSKDNSVWLIHYRNVKENADLRHALEKFL